jgi:hypothetical protein
MPVNTALLSTILANIWPNDAAGPYRIVENAPRCVLNWIWSIFRIGAIPRPAKKKWRRILPVFLPLLKRYFFFSYVRRRVFFALALATDIAMRPKSTLAAPILCELSRALHLATSLTPFHQCFALCCVGHIAFLQWLSCSKVAASRSAATVILLQPALRAFSHMISPSQHCARQQESHTRTKSVGLSARSAVSSVM